MSKARWTEWRSGADKTYSFLVAPAELTFDDVRDLAVHFDCRSIAMGPLSIGELRRESTEEIGPYRSSRWRIVLNFPAGEISFLASGFVQALQAPPVESKQQYLRWQDRSRGTTGA